MMKLISLGMSAKLDQRILEQVCAILNNYTESDQSIQNEIKNDIQTLSSLPNLSLYLLSAVANEELTESARCAAAIMMKKTFTTSKNKDKKMFRDNVYPVLAPFFSHEPSPLVNSIASLFADLLSYFGIDTFPDIADILIELLDDVDYSMSGLALLYELLRAKIPVTSDLIEALAPHLETEHAIYVLYIMAVFAVENPAEVKEYILAPIIDISFESLSSDEIIRIIEIIGIELKAEMDEALIEFLHKCLQSSDDTVVAIAASVFEENDQIPFYPEIFAELYKHLSANSNLYLYNSSVQCIDSLTAMCLQFPEEVMHEAVPLIQNAKIDNKSDSICAMRFISNLASYFEDISQIMAKVLELQAASPEDAFIAASQIAETFPETSDGAYSLLFPALSSPNLTTRVRALKAFIQTEQSAPPPPEFAAQLVSMFGAENIWELMIVVEAVGYFFESHGPAVAEIGESEEMLGFVISRVAELGETDPVFISAINALPLMIRPSAAFGQAAFEAVGDRLFASLFDDDTQLASGALDFYTSLLIACGVELSPQTFEEIMGALDRFLTSYNGAMRCSVWNYILALAFRSEALFDPLKEVLAAAATDEVKYEPDGTVLDSICAALFILFDGISLEGCLPGIRNLFAYARCAGLLSEDVASLALKAAVRFPNEVVLEQDVLEEINEILGQMTNEAKQSQCIELLSQLTSE